MGFEPVAEEIVSREAANIQVALAAASRKPRRKKQPARQIGRFLVNYVTPLNEEHKKWEALLKGSRMLENNARLLNSQFALPVDVVFEAAECGVPNAFYDPETHKVILCYEMFVEDSGVLAKVVTVKECERTDAIYDHLSRKIVLCHDRALTATQALDSAVIAEEHYTLFHELGHALIAVYDIPAVGREEDAVDQFATKALIDSGDDGVVAAQLAAAAYAESAKSADQDFWDAHSFDQQRFYDIFCLIYGSDPKKHAGLVSDELLPQARADGCEYEYQHFDRSWDALLAPHLKARRQGHEGSVVTKVGAPPVAAPIN